MKIKTQDLFGSNLDWAVAKAAGRLGTWIRDDRRLGTSILDVDFDENGILMCWDPSFNTTGGYVIYSPSTKWSQAGSIIEGENINLSAPFIRIDETFDPNWGGKIQGLASQIGPTALVAAMRCYVASKLGDVIEITEECLKV